MSQNLVNFFQQIQTENSNPSVCLILVSGVLIGRCENPNHKSKTITLSSCIFNGIPLDKHKMEVPFSSIISWGRV